ncbi:hypothetical protein BC936DRAFT_139362 [Jimgerdemannia flammicorona]|uniref:Uncharacterized protein n=1 Tax=Jimgerdemannia flammicorona TaxID=994334 RepID=A0A433DHT0_9FUNG|nr:hypothetical protein BC936DRAFT_139362 [Jimgerdemannia flammicorona]
MSSAIFMHGYLFLRPYRSKRSKFGLSRNQGKRKSDFILYPRTWDNLIDGTCGLCKAQIYEGIFMDAAGLSIW